MTSIVDEAPYDVDYVSFARYSDNFLLRTPSTSANINKQRLIIPGSATCKSANLKYAGMYEIFLPDPHPKKSSSSDHITFKSFEKDYNKPNASISTTYADNDRFFLNAADVHTFITKDNKYIIMFHGTKGYNIYDIENDKWLLESNNTSINTYNLQCQSLLINDEILILSVSHILFFYSISNSIAKERNHFLNPKLLKSLDVFDYIHDYNEHGICLLDCVYMEKNEKYLLKILVFGGFDIDFEKSFCLVDIKIDLKLYFSQHNNHSNDIDTNISTTDSKWLTIKQTLHDITFISGKNKANYNYKLKSKKLRLHSFGCQTILNSNDEKIILIIGPSAYNQSDYTMIKKKQNDHESDDDDDDKDASSLLSVDIQTTMRSSVLEYNTVNQTIILHENVCFMYKNLANRCYISVYSV